MISSGARVPPARARPHRHLQPSYYENTRRARPPEDLRNEGLSKQLQDDKSKWDDRYRSMWTSRSTLTEQHARDQNFPAYFEEEQRKRFLARIDDPDKNWK